MTFRHLCTLLLKIMLFVSPATFAEDIDLFLGSPPAEATDAPSVLFLIDNTANWNEAFEDEMAALAIIFENLANDALATGEVSLNVGIAMFGQPPMGYIGAGIRPMTAENATAYLNMIEAMTLDGASAGSRTMGRTLSEIHRYLTSQDSVQTDATGSNLRRDYAGNTSGNPATNAVHALPNNPLSSNSDRNYTSPVDPASCADTYVIYIGNTPSNGAVAPDSSARNNDAIAELTAAGGDTTPIPLNYTGVHDDNIADEWARFMSRDFGISFYTLDVNPTPRPGGNGNGMNNSALLESMADQSNGRYLRTYSGDGGIQIAEHIENILIEIQAVDSVFASVALPVSTTGQSVFLNQVFLGLFRPDADGYPRWHGNLKQYKLSKDDNAVVRLHDAEDNTAINENTGFINPCARSYWTPESADDYWAFDPQGDCNNGESNSPDGPHVEKGGQAYLTRASSPVARKVFTCDADNCSTAVDTLPQFTDTNTAITAELLGISEGSEEEQLQERSDLINWMRGEDLDNEDLEVPAVTTNMRPSVHGDIIHSRPIALNLGSDGDPEVVVFYGGNDGMLRAVNGNRSAVINRDGLSVPAGGEFWAFMPPEFYTDIARLRDNTETIRFPNSGTSMGTSGSPKAYGIDGPITAYEGNGKTFLYAGMRRAGRLLYAFDVSNMAAPKLKWKKGCPNLTDDIGCTVDPDSGFASAWSAVGQTWSPADVIYADGYADGDAPLLLMGGGYDDCEDSDNNSTANHSCTTSKGAVIYVLDGDTGNIRKTFPTLRGVVGSITVVPVRRNNRKIKYAYAADMGGNVYRISGGTASTPGPIGDTPVSDWIMTRIASLGCSTVTSTTAGCAANRKFLFGPDVLQIPNSSRFAILLGSGDREKPLKAYGAAYAVNNYFYSMVDAPSSSSWLNDDSPSLCGVDLICHNMLTSTAASITGSLADETQIARVTAVSSVHPKGWKFALAEGEQVVTSALTINDVAAFSTHTPVSSAPDSCENNLGRAITYNVNFRTAVGTGLQLIGGSLAPSPVAGKVILDNGEIQPFCIGCGGEKSVIGARSADDGTAYIQPSSRVYWSIEK